MSQEYRRHTSNKLDEAPHKKENLFPSGKVLFKNSLFSIFMLLLSYIVIYFYNIILARLLTPAQYGDIGVTIAIITICIPLLLIGGNLASKLYLGSYFMSQDYSHARGFLVWLRRRFLIGTLVISIIGTLLITADTTLLNLGIIKQHFFHPAIYAFWLVPLATFATLQSAIANALQRFVLSIFPIKVLLYLLAMPIFYIYAVCIDKMNTYSAIFCIGITYVIVIIVQTTFLYINFPSKYFNIKVKMKHIEWHKTSLQLFISTLAFLSVATISLVMVEVLATQEGDVGIFTAILAITGSLPLPSLAFNYIISPIIAPAFTQNQIPYLQKLLHHCNFFNIIITFTLLVIIIFFGKTLLAHFNPTFSLAYSTLLICAISFAIYYLAFSAIMLLMYHGQTKLLSKILIAQLLIIIVLDLILIPEYQMLGAAISLACGYITAGLAFIFFARRHIKDLKTFFIL